MEPQPINVLLVDDDPGMEKIVRAWLRSIREMRFNLSWAGSLGQGLGLLGSSPVDIVLLDLNLPDSMGLDTVTRARETAPALPIVVLTSNDASEIGVSAVKMGAQDYLTKGDVNVQQLRRAIVFAMERKRIELEVLAHKDRIQEHYESLAQATRRLVSDEVLSQLVGGGEARSEKRLVTIMFADVRGFTSFAESNPAEAVVQVLNQVLTEMVISVVEEGGYLDKFLGDGLMAIFGAPTPLENQWFAAARAAFKMQARIDLFNRQRVASHHASLEHELKIGVGINSGNAVVGFIGAQDRCEYTAIGDCVNIASRICAHAAPGETLITQVVWDGIRRQGEIEDWRILQLKGKKLAIEVAGLKYVRL